MSDFKELLISTLSSISPVQNETILEYEKRQHEEIEQEKSKKLAEIFGERYKDCTFDNYIISNEDQKLIVEKCKKYVDMSKSKGESLLMYGKSGTGKNHLLTAMFRDCYNYIELAKLEYLNAEKMALQKKGKNWMDGLEKYTKCQILIIPDLIIRSEGLSESVKELLLYIIDERYNNYRPVVICTNIDVKGLKKAIDFEGTERVSDRLKEMIKDRVLCLNWESYRNKKNKLL